MSRRTWRRAWQALALAAQLAAVVAPLADARLESLASLEGERPAHVHDDCALCFHLAQSGGLPPATELPEPSTAAAADPRTPHVVSAAPGWRTQPRGRSPPTV